ncbi:MAG: hypothetical protein AAF383_15735 [Cyanobacteria bacterium P01_A01_bin.83]
MNINAFVIASVASIVSAIIPNLALSQPQTSSEGINLEVTPAQNTRENSTSDRAEESSQNERIEVDSEKISSENNGRSETFELDQNEDDCHVSRTNQSSNGKTLEGYCEWDWRF